MQTVNRVTAVYSETVIVPVGITTIGALLTSTTIRVCQSVFVYSPLNDGIYTDNTLPILIGGREIAAAIGQPLLPGQFIYFDISDTNNLFVFEPSGAGTQLLIVTVSS